MADAHFTRTDTAEGARFDVTPAPKLLARRLAIGLGVVTGLVILVGASAAGGQVGFLLSAILWGPLLGASLFSAAKGADPYPRVPTTLTVNAEGVRVGGTLFAARDIAEFIIQHPRDHGGTYVRSTTARIGDHIQNAHENRSFALMARLKSSSRPQLLVFGLTYNTGCALMNDVSAALNGRSL